MHPQIENAGKYTCVATNEAGSSELDMVLRVIIPPKIDRSNKIGNPLVGNFSLRTPNLVVQNTKQINKQKFELNFTGHKYQQEDRIFDTNISVADFCDVLL